MSRDFDLCEYCCKWVHGLEGKSPLAVRDAYPRMMRKVLRHHCGMGKEAASLFIEDACCGNWLKLHETDVERNASAGAYAEMLVGDVWYCSDRWSWDRVLRIQWLYRRLCNRCREVDE